jgi:hypothetical protein
LRPRYNARMSERTKRIARLIGWLVVIALIGFLVYRLVTAPVAPPRPPRATVSPPESFNATLGICR